MKVYNLKHDSINFVALDRVKGQVTVLDYSAGINEAMLQEWIEDVLKGLIEPSGKFAKLIHK